MGAIRISLGNYTFLNNFIFMFICMMTQCSAYGEINLWPRRFLPEALANVKKEFARRARMTVIGNDRFWKTVSKRGNRFRRTVVKKWRLMFMFMGIKMYD